MICKREYTISVTIPILHEMTWKLLRRGNLKRETEFLLIAEQIMVPWEPIISKQNLIIRRKIASFLVMGRQRWNGSSHDKPVLQTGKEGVHNEGWISRKCDQLGTVQGIKFWTSWQMLCLQTRICPRNKIHKLLWTLKYKRTRIPPGRTDSII